MIRNNLLLKISSLLLAMFLWVYVMAEVDPTTTELVQDIPVRLQHNSALEKKGLTVRSTKDMKVSISVTGKRTAVVKLQKSKIKLTADLRPCQAGQNRLPVKIGLPEGITLAQEEVPVVKINVEKRVTAYQPVQVVFQGEPPPNREPGQVSTKPRGLEIQGGQSAVAQVKEIQVKADASLVTGDQSVFYLSPRALDKDGKPVEGVELSAKKVEVQANLCHLKTVPLKIRTVGALPAPLRIASQNAPQEVTIKGSNVFLDRVKKITTKPINLKRIRGKTTLTATLSLPKGIEVASQFADLKIQLQVE